MLLPPGIASLPILQSTPIGIDGAHDWRPGQKARPRLTLAAHDLRFTADRPSATTTDRGGLDNDHDRPNRPHPIRPSRCPIGCPDRLAGAKPHLFPANTRTIGQQA